MKLSVTVYSLREYFASGLTVPRFIELMAKLGADGVDLGYYWRGRDEMVEAKRKLEEEGLELACYITGNDFALPREEDRRAEVERVKKVISEAKWMGADKLRVFAGNLRQGVEPDQAEKWAVEALTEVADYAREEGVTLVLENHGNYFSRLDVVERILKSVKGLKLNFDSGNFVRAGCSPLEAAEKLGEWTLHVHAKDVDVHGNMCAPGEGALDFERILSVLRDRGFNGYVSIEYEGRRDQLLGVGLGLGYLKAVLLKLEERPLESV